jgi:hypothetical protein
MDAERLGGKRHLTDRLSPPRLGRERERIAQQLMTITQGDGELEAGEQDTDDHANTCSHAGRTDRTRRTDATDAH